MLELDDETDEDTLSVLLDKHCPEGMHIHVQISMSFDCVSCSLYLTHQVTWLCRAAIRMTAVDRLT